MCLYHRNDFFDRLLELDCRHVLLAVGQTNVVAHTRDDHHIVDCQLALDVHHRFAGASDLVQHDQREGRTVAG